MSDHDGGRVLLCGATVVLADRVESGSTVVIEAGRIVDLVRGPRGVGQGETRLDYQDHVIVPGFVDVHVHGAMGVDVLDDAGSVAAVAASLPRWGVTAFCPTTVACAPPDLERVLIAVRGCRGERAEASARVIGAHLESNFIHPDWRGAQPADCLRRLGSHGGVSIASAGPTPGPANAAAGAEPFSAGDILDVVGRYRPDVAVFTMAPDVDPDGVLLARLTGEGVRVSIGHTGATFDQAMSAIAAGARHATHLYNRMTPMTARDPGVVGAVLASDDVAAEVICDAVHVHPATVRTAWRAKGPGRVMAITDGTAGAGLPRGARARLGGRTILVDDAARLEDGTMAGSVLTMDRAFAMLVNQTGADLVQAAQMCATTPARELGLIGHGVITPGASADLVVLDARLSVTETWIDGKRAWSRPAGTSRG